LAACSPQLRQAIGWAFSSHELHNFTYEITRANCEYLAHTVSVVTAVPYSVAMSYIRELKEDEEIRRYVIRQISQGRVRHSADQRCEFGRRLGWYAFVRILKPRLVVETGVDKGLGAVAICAALLRNESEGFAGQYLGTDINPGAGFLLADPYKRIGKILYGDSILSLQSIREIDIFINDSDHSADYERREYEIVAPKMGMGGGLILGDNSHCTDVLARFSTESGRQFIFFREEPLHHWYPGAGIGISFVKQTRQPLDGVNRSSRLGADAKPGMTLATDSRTLAESARDAL
jgi:hypothetical protein